MFYVPPKQKVFEELRENAIQIRLTYDDTYSYATEKIERLPKENIWSNFMTIFNMFDAKNQSKLLSLLWEDALTALRNRIDREEIQYLFPYNDIW